VVGGPPESRNLAWLWVGLKDKAARSPGLQPRVAHRLTMIAESRLDELRVLHSEEFDFTKLVRLCEELNSSYNMGNYFATAMLTRGVLDHVPPVFGKASFGEVANNYSGSGRSFKETMHQLENAARKVADAHLHMPIRKKETCGEGGPEAL
jgi:hypothetical protein